MISLVGPRAAATAASKPSKCKTVVNVTDSEPESTVTGFACDSKGNDVLPLHCTSCTSDPKLEQDDSKQITLGLELILFQLGKLSNSDLEFVIRKISTRLLLKDGPTVSAARDSESFRVGQDYLPTQWHPPSPFGSSPGQAHASESQGRACPAKEHTSPQPQSGWIAAGVRAGMDQARSRDH